MRASGQAQTTQMVQNIIKKTGKVYESKSVAARQRFQDLAQIHVHKRRREIDEDMEFVRAEIKILESRMQATSNIVRPMLFQTAAWDEKDLSNFTLLSESFKFGAARVKELRSQALVTPPPLTKPMLQMLNSHGCWADAVPTPPSWAQSVISRREAFDHTVLLFQRGNLVEAWKVLFAIKSPQHLELARLEVQDLETPFVECCWHALEEHSEGATMHHFKDGFDATVSACQIGPMDASLISVVPGVMHQRGTSVTSGHPAVSFQMYLDWHPPPTPKTRTAANRTKSNRQQREEDELINELPWVQDLLEGPSQSHDPLPTACELSSEIDAVNAGDVHTDGTVPGDTEDIFGDVDMDELQARIHEARADLGIEDRNQDDNFSVQLLAGAASLRDHGEVYHGVIAKARTDIAKEFCEKQGMNKAWTFECSTALYAVEDALVLGRCWAHRMDFFLRMAIAHNEVSWTFTSLEKAEYSEPSELQELHQRASGYSDGRAKQAVHKRIARIRILFM